MDEIKYIAPSAELYSRIYDEIDGYGLADSNHCPGIRLYPYYKDFIDKFKHNNLIDFGCGTGETVNFFRKLKINANGLDWIDPRNEFCKKANITLSGKYGKYAISTCFDVIEHLNNRMVIGLFKNMMQTDYQILTIANTPSCVNLDGNNIDLHINKKDFSVWRTILLDFFDILEEIQTRDYQNLYICKKKGTSVDYLNYISEKLVKNGYDVRKREKFEDKIKKIAEGYWYYPVDEFVYDDNYFDKYINMANSEIGQKILSNRLNDIHEILKKFNLTTILDIGIGSGTIVNNVDMSFGYDVNPKAIKWLKKSEKWYDIYAEKKEYTAEKIDLITFFDSFEHIKNLDKILNTVTKQILLITIPIFDSYEDLLNSKHFRMDEHYHYFTYIGLINFMNKRGFKLLYNKDGESRAGRENIYTFIFRRIQ